VVGFCLKALVMALPTGPWLQVLYYNPSPIPVFWAHTVRFLPVAVFFLWPVVRAIPRELLEAAQLDGAGPFRQLVFVVWPLTRGAVGVVAAAVAALALGEHETAARVAAPGWDPFAKLLFYAMHYGSDADVAALSLLLLGSLVAAALLALGVRQLVRTVRAPRS
jgi:ABC-type Fe3+ transport system permease subunit